MTLEDNPLVRLPMPFDATGLFPELRQHLVSLLSNLTQDEWEYTTTCPGWSVRDVALHLLGVDLGYLSGRRDRYQDPCWRTASGDAVADLAIFNANWVVAGRRISPRLLCELLTITGDAVSRYHATLDLSALGQSVWWVGPDPAPVWLDVAREYTERWVHQQQIREAVGKPGLRDARYLAPVIATFVHALPRALHGAAAPRGTVVRLLVEGDAGGRWIAVRGQDQWTLAQDDGRMESATVTMDQDTAWRLWTRGITPDDARPSLRTDGDPHLVAHVLDMVSIIA